MPSFTPQYLSQKLLKLFGEKEIKAPYLRDNPESENTLNFSVYLFIVASSLMVNAKYSFNIEPSDLAMCHQSMLSCWGSNRIVRITDFIKAPIELQKIVELAKYQSDPSLSNQAGEVTLSLYSLLGTSLLFRMKLYEEWLLQVASAVDHENSLKTLAELTDHLITGDALDARLTGSDFFARSFRVLVLNGMLEKYLQGVEEMLEP